MNKMADILVHLFAVGLNKPIFLEAGIPAILDLTKKMHKKNAAILSKLESLSSMLV